MDAVRASGLVKRFGATAAVDGVDLALAPGQVRGLLGPNGAGKTTLLRMLFGLIHPDAGAVELLGRPFDGLGGEALEGVGGFVEEPAFYPYLSGRANLRLLARLDGGPSCGRGRGRARARGPGATGARTAWPATRPGCASGSGWRPRCCARRGCCCSTSRRAGSTRPARARSHRWCASWPPRAWRCCSRATRSASSSGCATRYTVMREGRVVWDGSAAELDRAGAGVGVRACDQR